MQIEIKQLHKSFTAEKSILKDISFSVQNGEIVSILGPSGCGKSTILRILAKLEAESSGETICNGETSFVFQEALLLDWRNALANVMMPLEIKGFAKNEAESKAKKSLEATGLANNIKQFPNELSGGMKMRVSLARALVTSPDVLLLDEPFAALDEMTREKLNEKLIELNHEQKLTMLLVTHNIFEAVYMSDRIIILNDSPATIKAIVDIKLPKPRKMEERGSPAFAEAVGKVQESLRSDV